MALLSECSLSTVIWSRDNRRGDHIRLSREWVALVHTPPRLGLAAARDSTEQERISSRVDFHALLKVVQAQVPRNCRCLHCFVSCLARRRLVLDEMRPFTRAW